MYKVKHFNLFIFIVILIKFSILRASVALWCDRTPHGVSVPKTPGDDGFRIEIGGNQDEPNKYIPGAVYTVRLKGPGDHFATEKFLGFMLVAEPADGRNPEDSAGNFQLTSDSLARFSEFCPHTVQHSSELPKSEVQVRWTAPASNAGCVNFRATIIKNKGHWFMDDGELTKQLCPESAVGDIEDVIDEPCCACDEAKYELTFEGLWSPLTHPKDFPDDKWSTHFGDIIGASHSRDFRFWEYGGVASDAFKNIAEYGDSQELERELKSQSQHIRTIIKARGLRQPYFYGHKTFAVFRADKDRNMISFVSKIAPSPDWIVGVSGLNLCLKNCTWVTERVLPLYPWDAGTDSGVSYLSPKETTIPMERINRIVWKSNKDSPFYDPKGNSVKPFARLKLQMLRTYEKECDSTFGAPSYGMDMNDDHYEDIQGHDTLECAVTEWSDWSPCSVTCDSGYSKRWRKYKNPDMAAKLGCRRKLTDQKSCMAPVQCRDTSNNFDPFSYLNTGAYVRTTERLASLHQPIRNDPCALEDWKPWSFCSSKCGKGLKKRYREYVNPKRARVYHCTAKLMETAHCYAEDPHCDNGNRRMISNDEKCRVSEWDEWSKCSVTLCGQGSQSRRRIYSNNSVSHEGCTVELMQSRTCNGLVADCNLIDESCRLPKNHGKCIIRRNIQRWYFDQERLKCVEFIFGGCEGNENNFESLMDCEATCEKPIKAVTRERTERKHHHGNPNHHYQKPIKDRPSYSRQTGYGSEYGKITHSKGTPHMSSGLLTPNNSFDDGPRIDCVVSKWSNWSECSVSCGRGHQYRTRHVEVFNQNGGKRCPKLQHRRICRGQNCPAEYAYQRSYYYGE